MNDQNPKTEGWYVVEVETGQLCPAYYAPNPYVDYPRMDWFTVGEAFGHDEMPVYDLTKLDVRDWYPLGGKFTDMRESDPLKNGWHMLKFAHKETFYYVRAFWNGQDFHCGDRAINSRYLQHMWGWQSIETR